MSIFHPATLARIGTPFRTWSDVRIRSGEGRCSCASRRARFTGRAGALLIAAAVGGCADQSAPAANKPLAVMTQVAAMTAYAPTTSLTGEVQPRFESELAFRTGGRVATRTVDVG